MRFAFALLGLLALQPGWAAATPAPAPSGQDTAGLPDGLYAQFVTPRGDFICQLYYHEVPLTVTNFAGLAEGRLGPAPRRPFYAGLKFYRVVPGVIVQGGDPTGAGDGGPGYTFPDEFVPGLRHDAAGVLSMANDGPDTNGSQFFLTLQPANRLNYLHTVFGRVVRGLDVLPRIRPDDVITAVHILRVGSDAQAFPDDGAAFDALKVAAQPYSGPLTPGPTANFDDPDHLLPTDPPRARILNFKLANFERCTGIHFCARVFARFQPTMAGQSESEFTGELADQLGCSGNGILALYFADTNTWKLQVSDDLAAVLAPTTQGADAALAAFCRQARQQTAEAVAAARAAHPDQAVSPAETVRFAAEAMLEDLTYRFGAAASTNN